MTPELTQKLIDWRAKAIAGTITLEEMKEAIIALRDQRRTAVSQPSPTTRASKAKQPTRSADDMLSELEGL